jgi:DNA-binding transcriptional MerR regulator
MHKGWEGTEMADRAAEGFSIGVLAARTGLTPAVLRTWDNRFGFPAGGRSPTGHRRYSEEDVRQVRRVVEVRDTGVPLRLAIDSVTRDDRRPGAESVHAALAAEFPDLRPQRLGRHPLLAVSHAVEDESLARADRPVVLGAFQEGHRFEQSRHRWDELARTASWAAVVADFDEALPADPGARPARCQLAADSPLRREWTVVTLSPSHAAVVSAWEVPSTPGEEPVFEAVISTHRPAVVVAARVLCEAARAAGATPPAEVERVLDVAAAGPATSAVDADRMWLRTLTRLDRRG